MAYCQWLFDNSTESLPGFGNPPGGTGVSWSIKNGADAAHFFAAAMAIGSRKYQTLVLGSAAGVNRPRLSGQRMTPTISTMPPTLPPARVVGSLASSGTKPRLTMTM